jgi:hypothetical protein
MSLGPSQIHPEQHLGPVGRLRAAGPGTDRQDRTALVELAGEQERRPFATEITLKGERGAIKLACQLLVTGLLDELEGGEEIVDAGLEATPELDLGSEAVGLSEDLLGGALVVPERRLAGQRLELRDAAFLGGKVKDAPRSTGSARPDRGPWTRPLVPRLEVLQQDRAELDQAKGRLAPGDDGVHAGTVCVVGADAAVAVTIERSRVTARPAVPLAGDEIDKRRFLGLLQLIPHSVLGSWGRGAGWLRDHPPIPSSRGLAGSIARRSPISKRKNRKFRAPGSFVRSSVGTAGGSAGEVAADTLELRSSRRGAVAPRQPKIPGTNYGDWPVTK